MADSTKLNVDLHISVIASGGLSQSGLPFNGCRVYENVKHDTHFFWLVISAEQRVVVRVVEAASEAAETIRSVQTPTTQSATTRSPYS